VTLALFLICSSLNRFRGVPKFEVYWESELSYAYNDDEQHNPWYIDLGNIASGGPGNLNGPSIVTIGFADICASGCQEYYPDEFCYKYPPEGIPDLPRAVDDWGTKYNITSEMMIKGIAQLHARGTKVHISYGREGLGPQSGGGLSDAFLDENQAEFLAQRMVKNVLDWDLDGVDILATAVDTIYYFHHQNVAFHYAVIRKLRRYLPAEKTISYTVWKAPLPDRSEDDVQGVVRIWNPMEGVISAAQRYLDYINVNIGLDEEQYTIDFLTEELGVPAYKIGWVLPMVFNQESQELEERMVALVNSIRERGLRGLSFFSANKEYTPYRGQFIKDIARNMYV